MATSALACHGHARADWQAVGCGYARAATAAHSVVADSQNIVWWPHSKTKSQKNIFTPFCCTLHKVSFEEFSSYFCFPKKNCFTPFRKNNFSIFANLPVQVLCTVSPLLWQKYFSLPIKSCSGLLVLSFGCWLLSIEPVWFCTGNWMSLKFVTTISVHTYCKKFPGN